MMWRPCLARLLLLPLWLLVLEVTIFPRQSIVVLFHELLVVVHAMCVSNKKTSRWRPRWIRPTPSPRQAAIIRDPRQHEQKTHHKDENLCTNRREAHLWLLPPTIVGCRTSRRTVVASLAAVVSTVITYPEVPRKSGGGVSERGEALSLSSSRNCWALDPQQAALEYDRYAKTYDWLDGTRVRAGGNKGSISTSSYSSTTGLTSLFSIPQARAELIGQARGHVLEIGVGTGLNLPYYNFSNIQSLTLLDVSNGMLEQAQQRFQELQQQQQQRAPIIWIQADATSQLVDLFSSSSFREGLDQSRRSGNGMMLFDTVIDSFSLCVMGNDGARQCIDQMSRVVKPVQDGGQLLLLENHRANDDNNPWLGRYQDWTAPTVASWGGKGCMYNQNVHTLLLENHHYQSDFPNHDNNNMPAPPRLQIEEEKEYAAGLIRAFRVVRL